MRASPSCLKGETLPLCLFLILLNRLKDIRNPSGIVRSLSHWKNSTSHSLTLNRGQLEETLKHIFKDPDYSLEQDLVDGDLIIPPEPPKFLKGYTDPADYPFKLTKTRIILNTYEGLQKHLRGENV